MIFGTNLTTLSIGLMVYGRAKWQEAEAVIYTSGQCVLFPDNFFEYISHIECAVILHSITNSGLIAGGQISTKERQTVFFTAVSPMNKNHKDPQELDSTKPRLAL